MLGDSMGTLAKGRLWKASCGHTELEFLIKQHTRPPAPFAETEQDLMESLDFFL